MARISTSRIVPIVFFFSASAAQRLELSKPKLRMLLFIIKQIHVRNIFLALSCAVLYTICCPFKILWAHDQFLPINYLKISHCRLPSICSAIQFYCLFRIILVVWNCVFGMTTTNCSVSQFYRKSILSIVTAV